MNILITFIVIMLQFVVGQILGFGVAYACKVGNGWELVVIPIGNILGVWGVGTIVTILKSPSLECANWIRLLGATVGSAIGVLIILITPAIGLIQAVFPLVGALLGFYFAKIGTNKGRRTLLK